MEANYLQMNGGHCYICHQDWKGTEHYCGGSPTPCTENCKQTSKIIGDFFDRQFKFCPHCGHKL